MVRLTLILAALLLATPAQGAWRYVHYPFRPWLDGWKQSPRFVPYQMVPMQQAQQPASAQPQPQYYQTSPPYYQPAAPSSATQPPINNQIHIGTNPVTQQPGTQTTTPAPTP